MSNIVPASPSTPAACYAVDVYPDECPTDESFEPTWEDTIEAALVLASPSPADVLLVRHAFATGGMGLFAGEWAIIRDAYERMAWQSVYGVRTAAEIHTAALDAAAVALRCHREALAMPPVCGGSSEADDAEYEASIERQFEAACLDRYAACEPRYEAQEVRGSQVGHDCREGGGR